MSDLISRSALIEKMNDYISHTDERNSEHYVCKRIKKIIEDAPTVEAKPVVHGEWLQEGNAVYHWRQNCSICGNPVYDKIKPYNFCPNCGCDMRGGKND